MNISPEKKRLYVARWFPEEQVEPGEAFFFSDINGVLYICNAPVIEGMEITYELNNEGDLVLIGDYAENSIYTLSYNVKMLTISCGKDQFSSLIFGEIKGGNPLIEQIEVSHGCISAEVFST